MAWRVGIIQGHARSTVKAAGLEGARPVPWQQLNVASAVRYKVQYMGGAGCQQCLGAAVPRAHRCPSPPQ